MQIRQARAFYGTVVISAAHRDYALLAGIGVNYQPVKARCNHLISFRQQKNGRRLTRFGIRNTVEVPWNLQSNWTREQPEIPPAKLTQNHLPQRWGIMQDQTGDRPIRSDMKCGSRTEARAKDDNGPIFRFALQRVESG
jgi:hypothetical protein